MAVRKTDNTWAVSFYYNEWNGDRVRHRKTGFKTKKEAQQYERDFLQNHSGTPEMSFGALVSLYMDDCKTRLRSTTYANKEYLIFKKIVPFFENVAIDSISPAMVRRWQTELMNDEHGYSETYLKTIHNQMSAIMNYAVKYYGLRSNPAAKCGAMGKKRADSMLFWTQDEFKRFEEVISDKLYSKVIFNLLYWTGMRSGELLALTLDDFDFQNNAVSITKSYARLGGEDIINPPKTPAGRRVVTVPASVMSLVYEYSQRLPYYNPSSRLFEFTKYYLWHEIDRGCKKSGVKRIRVHDLRHSHASLLIELGYSPLLIAERLGHENIETTLQTYSHLYPNKQEQLAKELEELILDKN